MNYWLVKTEPGAYSWEDLIKDKWTFWDGVRNPRAKNNLKAMKNGDKLLFYHSVSDKTVMGIAKVIKEHYQDPSTNDSRWVAVDIEPLKALKNPVHLHKAKEDKRLKNMVLVRNPRLSVQPVTKDEFETVVELGK